MRNMVAEAAASLEGGMLKFLWTATALAALPLSGEASTFESDETPAALVELFTSEGCSSCPPADTWISKLKTSPDLWKRVVPVVFHVDYWDGLGWPDRFATAEYTARQRRYATGWGTNSVYTPGVVLNGREWRDWHGRSEWPASTAAKVGKLTVTVGDGRAEITFAPGIVIAKTLQVEVALLGSNLESNVTRGENGGRKLRHDFTVLHFASAPLRAGAGRLTASVPLPAKSAVAPAAIALWVTTGEARTPIQATGGWLQKP